MKPLSVERTSEVLAEKSGALGAVGYLPEDRSRWQMSHAQLSAFVHWNHHHEIKNLAPTQVYYKKLEEFLGFPPQTTFLDKGVFKGKVWGIEYPGGLECLITFSNRGTGLLVPKSYTQNELDRLLPLVLETLKIQDSLEKYYKPFRKK